MTTPREKIPIDDWDGQRVKPGQSKDLKITVSESYSGMSVKIPLHVRRGEQDGPVVFVTAALHGNEINGTGAVRSLIQDEALQLKAGAVILVPVINLLGFERHSRYLPDRRDLNRSFPGTSRGSLASRMARSIFDEIVRRCDYGIDLHTAAVRRTNFPNVRGDLKNAKVKWLAEMFGCEIILAGGGPKGSLRREACKAGCPTVILEAGEVWKVQPAIVECCARGVKNVLIALEMLEGEREVPPYQVVVEKTSWVRADYGGFLQFHVAPGDLVEKDQPLASNTSLLGRERNVLTAPFDGVVLGMTTLPAVSPGEPVCHLGAIADGIGRIRKLREKLSTEHLHERTLDNLASGLLVVDPTTD